uniref:Uncharacterized protein n=2 Tax=unclassified Caudoviricetes TaxID=2788787 RepID=A0A8S5Q714_9CAUD|nr:MAG TPA: hypothetical protein [Siphoviridae sp. ctAvK3]DAE15127.1 MAG TPA: hypothetical protein [Siphoviridae sp. ctdVv30]
MQMRPWETVTKDKSYSGQNLYRLSLMNVWE